MNITIISHAIRRSPAWLLLLILSATSVRLSACERYVTYPVDVRLTEGNQLVLSLLELSLSKLDKKICLRPEVMTNSLSRKVAEVSKGHVGLVWAGLGPVVEKELRPIRIPVLRGLPGYRLFIIRAGDEKKFQGIKSIDDLRDLSVGATGDLPDRTILEHAGLDVQPIARNVRLWPMLRKKRFDYILWGCHHIFSAMDYFGDGLVVEPNLLMFSPMVSHIYVRAEDQELHELIKTGMMRAIEDGSYDRMLFGSELIQRTFSMVQIENRQIIYTDNPLIDKKTLQELEKIIIRPNELGEKLAQYR